MLKSARCINFSVTDVRKMMIIRFPVIENSTDFSAFVLYTGVDKFLVFRFLYLGVYFTCVEVCIGKYAVGWWILDLFFGKMENLYAF